MDGYVAPTDSRFRKDQRLYEEGKIEEADAEKLMIEEEQWNKRELAAEGKIPDYEPRYFCKVVHPHI
jgi:hypothetical protein